MDNHPILLICVAFVGGAGITHGIWSHIARRLRRVAYVWHNVNFTDGRVVTQSNKVQQRATVGSEDE